MNIIEMKITANNQNQKLLAMRLIGLASSILMLLFISGIRESDKMDIPGINSAKAVIYVSPQGNDEWAGTIQAPFKTLEKARDAVRNLKSSGDPLRSGPVAVILRGGVYPVEKSFTLDQKDSGCLESPVIYMACPGEKVVLTGAKTLEREWFHPISDPAILTRIIDQEAAKRIVALDLRSHGITAYGQLNCHGFARDNLGGRPRENPFGNPPMMLYTNGKRQILARWPNAGTVQMEKIIEPGPVRGDPDFTVRGGTFSVGFDRMKYWRQAEDIWVDGIFGYSWEWSYNKVSGFDAEKRSITLGYGEISGINRNWSPDFHHYENLLEEIDMPGEYMIERKTGMLYYYPEPDFYSGETDITVSVLEEPMIILDRVSGLEFRDLIFETSRGTAVEMTDCREVAVDHCEFKNIALHAVKIQNSTACGVRNSVIHDIGSAGIIIGGGNIKTLEYGNCFVENCEIYHVAFYSKVYQPAVLIEGVGNTVFGSSIHHTPHAAIRLFGNDQIIERNEIYSCCLDFEDMGAVSYFTLYRPQERGNVIRKNYFYNIGTDQTGVHAIYADDQSMGLVIEMNLFDHIGKMKESGEWGPSTGINLNSASYIAVSKNIFIDCPVPVRLSTHSQKIHDITYNWHAQLDPLLKDPDSAHFKKYPELILFWQDWESTLFHASFVLNKKMVEKVMGTSRHIAFTDNQIFNTSLYRPLVFPEGYLDEFDVEFSRPVVRASNNRMVSISTNTGLVEKIIKEYTEMCGAKIKNKPE
ncbi:MAG TPA: hypothetical protein DD727_07400 [Clostridiales bacterium]|nr:hypothetical protein [Clostridiales bacterium]